MRDKIKDSKYYLDNILHEQSRINKFLEALNSLDESNVKGIVNSNLFLSGFYKNLFKLKYSAGFEVNEIFNEYLCWINHYRKVCNKNDSLYDLADLFAIGVFFDKRKKEFVNILLEIFNKCCVTDGMIKFFLSHLMDEEYLYAKSKFNYFDKLYQSKDKKNNLNECIASWYQLHNDAYWFDSHKSQNNVYCGYWSFDIGAVVKILNICDVGLLNVEYYPYDLVHH